MAKTLKNHFLSFKTAYIIAEIGVNHNGSIKLAKNMIDEATKSGADAVKFQTFKASSLVTQGTPKVRYQEATTSPKETHYEMIKKLELSKKAHFELSAYCKSKNIDFISTPYDVASAKFLIEDLGIKYIKTASADIVDLLLHEYLASTGLPVIIATGMSNLGDIERVLNIYKKQKNQNVVLLHCVSNYPCSDESLNLRSMETMFNAFNLPVGYSDHSIGFLASSISIALGAKIIEKHFTLDKNLPGPDHKASSTPEEFSELVKNIRRTESILGSSDKCCQQEEQQMSSVSRKSVVLSRDMSKGDILNQGDLVLMRPGSGMHPMNLFSLYGKKLSKNLKKYDQLNWQDIESK